MRSGDAITIPSSSPNTRSPAATSTPPQRTRWPGAARETAVPDAGTVPHANTGSPRRRRPATSRHRPSITMPATPRRLASVANSSPATARRPPWLTTTSTSPGRAASRAANNGRWSSRATTGSAGPAKRTSGTIARIAGSTTGSSLSASHSAETSISSSRAINSSEGNARTLCLERDDVRVARIYVTGHRNPDTDSIASAIGYAELRRRLDPRNEYVAVRLGDLNAQTSWVLEQAEAPEPPLLPHVLLRVGDVMRREFPLSRDGEPVREVGLIMARGEFDLVPIVDDAEELAGVMTERALARRYVRESREASRLDAPTAVGAIAKVLEGEVLVGEGEQEVGGRVWVLAMAT